MNTGPIVLFCLLFSLSSAYATASFNFSVEDENNASKEANQKVYSNNPEANAMYIQGLEYLNKGNPQKGGSVLNGRKALELFRRAVQKDPQFALAYIGQADALDLSASYTSSGTVSPASIYSQQEAAVLKALALDDNLPQAHTILAEIYYDKQYDWAKAEKEFRRVIELTPDSVYAHTRYALFLGTMGRFEEAEAQVQLAQAIDGTSAAPNRALMRILYWQHKDDAALAEGIKALKKDKLIGTHWLIGCVYIHQGQFDKGIEELKLGSFGDAESLATLAYAYARAGRKAELEKTLEQLKHHPAYDQVSYRMAAVYAALGQKDRAIALINKDYERRSNWLNWLKVDPVMDPLRQEPGFKQIIRKLNFEQ
jgi:Tfp pilus assembly protein PilF